MLGGRDSTRWTDRRLGVQLLEAGTDKRTETFRVDYTYGNIRGVVLCKSLEMVRQ
jgi:hypothetical protein